MSDKKLLELQQLAENALKSDRWAEGASHLSEAVQLCSDEAIRLKTAYVNLQERFERVNEELTRKVDQLTRATSFMNNVLQKISEAILFIDLNGVIAIANESALRILQTNRETLLFKKFWDLFPDELFGFSMREALRYGISHTLLYKTLSSGKEIEIGSSFLYEGPKNQHGFILIFRDITERKKIEQIVARGDRLKELGEMAAKVAHEIRNPLGGIRGFATLLYRDLEEEKHLQEMAAQVIEGTKSLEKLVTSVLQYARPVEVKPISADLTQFVKQVGRFIRVDPAFPPTVKLLLNIPNEPLLVPFDPEALKRALLNLLFNAIQAMPEGGVVTLSLLKRDMSSEISISDTGIGMSEEQKKLLFSPLFTTKSEGNGLGLVEAQKIVQAHGGAIDARTIQGKGSTFTITLPLKRV